MDKLCCVVAFLFLIYKGVAQWQPLSRHWPNPADQIVHYACARHVRLAINKACFSLIATFSCKEMGTDW